MEKIKKIKMGLYKSNPPNKSSPRNRYEASKLKQMNKRREMLKEANRQTGDRPNSKTWSWYNVSLFHLKRKNQKKGRGKRDGIVYE